jgi:hypothetical protein
MPAQCHIRSILWVITCEMIGDRQAVLSSCLAYKCYAVVWIAMDMGFGLEAMDQTLRVVRRAITTLFHPATHVQPQR